MKKLTMKIECITEDGRTYHHEAPARYEVCDRCEGSGTHVNPAIDGHGLSREDFDEDPEFEEAYFAGRFDIVCEECRGKRVILTPAIDKCPEEVQRDYWREEEGRARDRAEAEAERRFGY